MTELTYKMILELFPQANYEEIAELIKSHNSIVTNQLISPSIWILIVPEGNCELLMDELDDRPDIKTVIYDLLVTPQSNFIPQNNWYHDFQKTYFESFNAHKAWNIGSGISSIGAAILDSGIATHHNLVINNRISIIGGSEGYHATMCAGAFAKNMTTGVVGLAHGSRGLWDVKIGTIEGATYSNIMLGLSALINSNAFASGTRVISLSYGNPINPLSVIKIDNSSCTIISNHQYLLNFRIYTSDTANHKGFYGVVKSAIYNSSSDITIVQITWDKYPPSDYSVLFYIINLDSIVETLNTQGYLVFISAGNDYGRLTLNSTTASKALMIANSYGDNLDASSSKGGYVTLSAPGNIPFTTFPKTEALGVTASFTVRTLPVLGSPTIEIVEISRSLSQMNFKGSFVMNAAGFFGTEDVVILSYTDSTITFSANCIVESDVYVTLTIIKGYAYNSGGGTSFSAPLAASLACMVWGLNPNLTNIEVKNAITHTARILPNATIGSYGAGTIDAYKAMLYIAKVYVEALPGQGTYNNPQYVRLVPDTTYSEGDVLCYYTVDGTTPTTSSILYFEPILVDSNLTLSYFVMDLAGHTSNIMSDMYSIITPQLTASNPIPLVLMPPTSSINMVVANIDSTNVLKIYAPVVISTNTFSNPSVIGLATSSNLVATSNLLTATVVGFVYTESTVAINTLSEALITAQPQTGSGAIRAPDGSIPLILDAAGNEVQIYFS